MLRYSVVILKFVSFSKLLSELGVHLLPWCGRRQRLWGALRLPQGIYGWVCALALTLPDIPFVSLLIFHYLFVLSLSTGVVSGVGFVLN